jgi:alpha-glucosidase
LKLGEGSFDWLPEYTDARTLGYRNGDVIVVHNFGEAAIPMPSGELLLRSEGNASDNSKIEPHETVWVRG